MHRFRILDSFWDNLFHTVGDLRSSSKLPGFQTSLYQHALIIAKSKPGLSKGLEPPSRFFSTQLKASKKQPLDLGTLGPGVFGCSEHPKTSGVGGSKELLMFSLDLLGLLELFGQAGRHLQRHPRLQRRPRGRRCGAGDGRHQGGGEKGAKDWMVDGGG